MFNRHPLLSSQATISSTQFESTHEAAAIATMRSNQAQLQVQHNLLLNDLKRNKELLGKRKVRPRKFETGELAWIHSERTGNNLAPEYFQTVKIIGQVGPNTYAVELNGRVLARPVNVRRLLKMVPQPEPIDVDVDAKEHQQAMGNKDYEWETRSNQDSNEDNESVSEDNEHQNKSLTIMRMSV